MAFLKAIAVLTSALALVQGSRAPEYQVKAVFLFNFAQFVEWHAPADAEARRAVVIGILGDDPFGAILDATLRGERLGARPFEVRRYRQWRDIDGCEILFISRSERDQIGEIVTGLRNRPILTVSDTDDFARRGGMIQLVTDKGRIRLRINLDAAQAANLTISSKLLRVAEIVRSSKR
ncbi:MAG: YfiR family protein [Gemmatimonadales bacterium]|nr:YfiR family protein [Gemmatimonadales bacterium]